MAQEAAITINGTALTDNESMVVRLALTTFEDVLANELRFKDDGIPLTDRYMTEIARVRALLTRTYGRINAKRTMATKKKINKVEREVQKDMLAMLEWASKRPDRWHNIGKLPESQKAAERIDAPRRLLPG